MSSLSCMPVASDLGTMPGTTVESKADGPRSLVYARRLGELSTDPMANRPVDLGNYGSKLSITYTYARLKIEHLDIE